MVPGFIKDWQSGLERFKLNNPNYNEFDSIGQPVFAGWVFNGFDTARKRRTKEEIDAGVPLGAKEMIQADQTMHDQMAEAIATDLIDKLNNNISGYDPIADIDVRNNMLGDIEDANVLIQNSICLNVPLGELEGHKQLATLQDRRSWADNQIEQIRLFKEKFGDMANNIIATCI